MTQWFTCTYFFSSQSSQLPLRTTNSFVLTGETGKIGKPIISLSDLNPDDSKASFVCKLKHVSLFRISDIAAGYDLSRYYQVNENMLTMRLIFPLDFSYVVSMIAFILLSAVFRLLLASIGRLMFTIAYELITVVNFYFTFNYIQLQSTEHTLISYQFTVITSQ